MDEEYKAAYKEGGTGIHGLEKFAVQWCYDISTENPGHIGEIIRSFTNGQC